jgi:hypothetical protein
MLQDRALLQHILFSNDKLSFPPAAAYVKACGWDSRTREEMAYIAEFVDVFFRSDFFLSYTQRHYAETGITLLPFAYVYSKPTYDIRFARPYSSILLLKSLSKFVPEMYWDAYPDLRYVAAAILDVVSEVDNEEQIADIAARVTEHIAGEALSDDNAHEIARLICVNRPTEGEMFFLRFFKKG